MLFDKSARYLVLTGNKLRTVPRFCMLFACGVGTGVFFFGVAEPIYHYAVSPNRFTADHAMPDNSLAQQAILLTFYHWGLHPWSVYTVVGLLLGLMAHR